jgi:gas vesicle protein
VGEKKEKSLKKGGFVVGIALGAVAGLLFAPRPGRETRDQWFGGGLTEQKDRLLQAVGAGKESAGDQSETLRRKIEETRSRLREQMDKE